MIEPSPFVHFLSAFVRLSAIIGLLSPLRTHLGVLGVATLAGSVALCTTHGEMTMSALQSIDRTELFALVLREVLCGSLIAAPLYFALEAVPFAGRLCDTFCGTQIAEQLKPGEIERSSSTEALLQIGVLAAVLSSGGYQWVVERIFSVPVLGPVSGAGSDIFLSVSFLCECTRTALWLAAPVLATVLIFDMVFALTGRFVTGFSAFSELPALRLAGGVFATAAVLAAVAEGGGIPLPPFLFPAG